MANFTMDGYFKVLPLFNFTDLIFTEGDTTTVGYCNTSVSTIPLNHCGDNNTEEMSGSRPTYQKVLPFLLVFFYGLIFVFGIIGNGLVIYVVLRFAKMKTVTNMYILNLAVSDVLFLFTLPMLATTTMLGHWMFGAAMCKIYYVLYSINLFGGAFNLCVMSADRYQAVCHPIRSMKYRTPRIALFLCLCIWSLSFLVMLPVILYTSTVDHMFMKGKYSCQILWPPNQLIPPNKAFIWYTFILGFALPVSLISVFYVLVVLRLRRVGAVKKSRERRKSHRRVTRMVLGVITIYVVCWLPYWSFQVHIVSNDTGKQNVAMVLLFNGFTVLSFANSMFNPFLYAFMSENFRKSFVKAFKCVSNMDVNGKSTNEASVFPKTCQSQLHGGTDVDEERVELSPLKKNTAAVTPGTEENAADLHDNDDDSDKLSPER